jgi:hypothetical protein
VGGRRWNATHQRPAASRQDGRDLRGQPETSTIRFQRPRPRAVTRRGAGFLGEDMVKLTTKSKSINMQSTLTHDRMSSYFHCLVFQGHQVQQDEVIPGSYDQRPEVRAAASSSAAATTMSTDLGSPCRCSTDSPCTPARSPSSQSPGKRFEPRVCVETMIKVSTNATASGGSQVRAKATCMTGCHGGAWRSNASTQ